MVKLYYITNYNIDINQKRQKQMVVNKHRNKRKNNCQSAYPTR